jgi:hypothetical protein
MKLHHGFGVTATKIPEEVPLVEAVLEAINDVVVRDVGDGGVRLEETAGVGPQGLVLLLFALRQVVTSTCP